MGNIVVKDRVQQTSTTTGTADFVMSGSVAGYQSFDAVGNNITYYAAVDPNTGDWEVGLGTYTVSTSTLTRTTILSSSTGGSKISFGAGAKNVFCTYPAEKAIYEEPSGNTLIDGGPLTVVGANVAPGYTTFSAALAEMYGNVASFAQAYARNFSNDPEASADFIVYRDNTVDENGNFLDMGINSEHFSSTTWPIFTQGSMYLYGNGGEMFIGSETSDLIFFSGGVQTTDEVGRFSATTGELTTRESINVGGNLNAVGGTFTAPVTSTSSSIASPSSSEFVVRSYVDSATSTAFVVHTAVRLATAAALSSNTYNNGTGGVGATLTATGNGALSVDGVTVNTNDRILVKNEVNQAYNGAYVVTQTGSGGTPYVLTRATDFDTTGSGEIANNAYFYVTAGSTNIGSSWILAQTAAITVGTTALPFSLFAQPIGYTVNSPLSLVGTTLSLTTVPANLGGTGFSSYTVGQLLYADTTTTLAKLSIGTTYNLLRSGAGGVPEWGTVNLASSDAVSGALGATNGGTGQSSYTTGDILYSSASNTLSKLAGNTTTTKKFLNQTGTGAASAAPSWDAIAAGDVSGLGTMATQNANNVAITGGAINGTTIGAVTPAAVTGTVVSGSTSVVAANGVFVNSATVSSNLTIASGQNGFSVGPLTVASGVTLTVAAGSRHVVI